MSVTRGGKGKRVVAKQVKKEMSSRERSSERESQPSQRRKENRINNCVYLVLKVQVCPRCDQEPQIALVAHRTCDHSGRRTILHKQKRARAYTHNAAIQDTHVHKAGPIHQQTARRGR